MPARPACRRQALHRLLEDSSGDLEMWLSVLCSTTNTVILTFVMCSSSARRSAGNEIIGIDLGTTNSCVAVMEGKVRAVIDVQHCRAKMPVAISLDRWRAACCWPNS